MCVPVAWLLLVNAILVPSGDHAGSWSVAAGEFVRFVSPVPSVLIVKMS